MATTRLRLFLAQAMLAAPAANCVAGTQVLTTAVVNVDETVTVNKVDPILQKGVYALLLLLLFRNGLKAPKKNRCCA